ncbi:MAG: N-acetyl-gamma-glutamyl-phosphate reductase [Firmicutes bacterium HGW-Firmicutes-15]|nr:MAG: N-acetyl-gamma-glutamyl-phosphate reductase [Firmicutes bacterium HGW-Firmicutes-15]
MYKVGIIGDGYTAAELLRLIAGHDELEAVAVSSTENIGRSMAEIYPHLRAITKLRCEATNLQSMQEKCDAVFLALPHGLSVPMVKELSGAGIKCVDLGADFRLKDVKVYEKYYEMVHEAPEMLTDAVYGLPELYRDKIKKTEIVANPGCFPTSAILPLAPLLEARVVENRGIIVDSKSGVTGAGKALKASSHFCEVNEGIKAYGVGGHRHGPEIAQELSLAAGETVGMIFTPHLVPMNRGILSTCYCRLKPGAKAEQVREVLEDNYSNEYFVDILPEGVMPHTKWVYGSNFVQIGVYADDESGNVILVSALDNICKGASGQAIQNLNLMLGIEESKGLLGVGVHP